MRKLTIFLFLILIAISGYSIDLQTTTNQSDSFYVNVLYSRIVKANQALTEIPHRRFQVSILEKQLLSKDSVINKLILANTIFHELNNQYREKEKALVTKGNEYDALYIDFKSEAKRANNNALALKIATPVIGISIGVGAFLLGWYLHVK